MPAAAVQSECNSWRSGQGIDFASLVNIRLDAHLGCLAQCVHDLTSLGNVILFYFFNQDLY